MSLPRNAVFAPTQSQARDLLRAFGLPADEWSSFGLSAAVAGRQFDRIVVRLPINPTGHDIHAVSMLRTRLSEKGAFEVIAPVLSTASIDPPGPAL